MTQIGLCMVCERRQIASRQMCQSCYSRWYTTRRSEIFEGHQVPRPKDVPGPLLCLDGQHPVSGIGECEICRVRSFFAMSPTRQQQVEEKLLGGPR